LLLKIQVIGRESHVFQLSPETGEVRMRYASAFFAAVVSRNISRGVRALKPAQLLRVGMVALAIVATGGVTVHAAVITLNVSASLSPNRGSPSCASTGCTLGGDIVIDTVRNIVIAADVTAIGFSPSVGPFTDPLAPRAFEGLTKLTIVTAPRYTSQVPLYFHTQFAGSLAHYTGGQLDADTDVKPQTNEFSWILSQGSLTQTTVTTVTTVIPEPSTWAMALLGFAGLGFLGYRRTQKGQAAAA